MIDNFDWLGGKIGDGIWEWESKGPPDDQRAELVDSFYVGHPTKSATVIRSWKPIGTLSIGAAYLDESISKEFSIQVGAEGGFDYIGVIIFNAAVTSTYSATLSTSEGNKATVTYYQLIETVYVEENDVIVETKVNHVESFGRVIEGWKWME